MSVVRVMGIETEYGISVPGQPHANATMISSLLVNAYADATVGNRRARARWDFDEETPLRDARGFDMSRSDADDSQLTDADIGLANAVLTNGARLYVDHAHPEYSSPEVLTPRDAVIYDRAGQVIMQRAAALASSVPGAPKLRVYKNNTDNKGASYGTHENYLMSRQTPFNEIAAALIPFFVTRQIITGAGRVGIGQDGRVIGFQLSQRADFFEVEVGLETTLKRPIINTRDEPHADPRRHRRLHVIVGDANLSETATYLKLGMTSILLSMIEAGEAPFDLALRRPVAQMHEVSHDPTLRHLLELRDGRRMSALSMQHEYVTLARKFVDSREGSSAHEQTLDVLDRWESLLGRLEHDPWQCTEELDWVAKLAVLEGYRRRDAFGWDAPRLALVDLQYADLEPGRGVAAALEARGRLARITNDAEVESAVSNPPTNTRAWFRGECLRRFPESVVAASWDSIVFDVGGQSLQRVPTPDPMRGTQAHVAHLLDSAASASELLASLSTGVG